MKALLLLTSLATVGETNLQTTLDEIRADQDVPGVSAVVIHNGDVVYAGGSGVADLETGRAATADTVYYIGSITKVLTAVLALRLVEQSTLALDNPVAGIATPVTVSNLLTHSSGLEREGDFGYWYSADFPDRAALSTYLSGTDLRSEPGAKLHYSNVGFAALGLAIESASKLSYDDALQNLVLGPLQMNATGPRGPAANVANGYTPNGRMLPSKSKPFAGVGQRVGDRHVRMYHDAKAMAPAFGAYSTANDLGRLALFLLGDSNDDVLSLRARNKMRERQPTGRGLGIGLERDGGRQLLTHGGWFAAHRSQLLIDATNNISIIVLTNSDSATPRRIADALHRAVLGTDISHKPKSDDKRSVLRR